MSTVISGAENGERKKIHNIQVSVDACAELGGLVYDTIVALQKVYEVSGLRKLTYVDTYQGFREKSGGTTPDTLFAFGKPYTRYGRFLHNNQDWVQITETHECKAFSHTLGETILPEMTAPIIDAIEEISGEIRNYAFKALQRNQKQMAPGQPMSLMGKAITCPDDIELEIEYYQPHERANTGQRRRMKSPLINEAIDAAMPRWQEIVRTNPALEHKAKKYKNKGELIDLIAYTQQSKAIAAALLYHSNPPEAARMGEMPAMVTESEKVPSLHQLRDRAHEFSHLKFPKDNGIWFQPEVQQAIRYTGLWPWTRKPHIKTMEQDKLNNAHRNTADRAAVSYFLNHLAEQPDCSDTLYVLVTHDGPLIDDFLNFITGRTRREVKLKGEERVNGVRREIRYQEMPPEAYEKRELPHIEPSFQPSSAILTGQEFVTFVKREQERVKKHMKGVGDQLDISQAMAALSQTITALEEAVQSDKRAFGITKGGTFKTRVRTRQNAEGSQLLTRTI